MAREIKIGIEWLAMDIPCMSSLKLESIITATLRSPNRLLMRQFMPVWIRLNSRSARPMQSTPDTQKTQMRETPWGYISYLDYRYKVEFTAEQYREIDVFCKERNIPWMVSVWDEPAVDFMENFVTPAYKIPSASLTDHKLLNMSARPASP